MKRIFIVLLCVISPFVLNAEVIHMKDGTKLVGTIVGGDATAIKVQTDFGVITIPRHKIKKVVYEGREEETGEGAGRKGGIHIEIQQQQQQQQQQMQAPPPPAPPSVPKRKRVALWRTSISGGSLHFYDREFEKVWATGGHFHIEWGRILNRFIDWNFSVGFGGFREKIYQGVGYIDHLFLIIPVEFGFRLYPFVTNRPLQEGSKVHVLVGSSEGFSFVFYIGAGVGILLAVDKGDDEFGNEIYSDGGAGFIFSPELGVELNFGPNFTLFFAFKYMANPGHTKFQTEYGDTYSIPLDTMIWKAGIRF